MADLVSPPPDHDAMHTRIAAAVDRYLDALPLTTGQERIIAMTLYDGGCSSGADENR